MTAAWTKVSGKRERFRSRILPPWCRRSPKVTEVLPLLYLHGMSSGDVVPALERVLRLGRRAVRFDVTRLTGQWQDRS